MRGAQHDVCGCFPTGRHYPGIADLMDEDQAPIEGLVADFEAARRWHELPIAVLDFETTGFEQTDRVVEVGLVCFQAGEQTAKHNWLVNPGMPIPEGAMKVHGITDEMVKDEPRFEEIAEELAGLLQGHLPVAYNAAFDRRFLHAEMARVPGLQARPPALEDDVVWIDPLVWARELQKQEARHRLVDVCARMGIALDDAHRAWADAEATGHVLNGLASEMPTSYGDLIRFQQRYGAEQEAQLAARRNRRR